MRSGRFKCAALVAAVVTAVQLANGALPEPKLQPADFGDRYVAKWGPFHYPQVAIDFHKTGKGWFELKVDRASGKVREIKVLRSTGVKVLDDSAAVALLQTQMKPGLLDHVVTSVEYKGRKYPEIGSHIPW